MMPKVAIAAFKPSPQQTLKNFFPGLLPVVSTRSHPRKVAEKSTIRKTKTCDDSCLSLQLLHCQKMKLKPQSQPGRGQKKNWLLNPQKSPPRAATSAKWQNKPKFQKQEQTMTLLLPSSTSDAKNEK
jgi:hypothetical protein